ncbi:MMPL family transporter [Rhizohabitans arisaemae]|uniref:MMPL family transporter n=1 Tax=Rhizohabitans arisaemae TaxID=2720610 RepID=UPI0024B1A576|nr:MMPL family transporter [Rhizohabitans arisaemae]
MTAVRDQALAARGAGGWLDRLGRLTVRRSKLVLALAGLVLAVSGVFGVTVGEELVGGGMVDPGAESTQANYLLETRFPAGRPNLVLLVDTPGGVDTPEAAEVGKAVVDDLSGIEGMAGAMSYWSTQDPRLRSTDGRSALVLGVSAVDPAVVADRVSALSGRLAASDPGFAVRVGGKAEVDRAIDEQTGEDLTRTELIVLPITFLLLLLIFGSVVSALLPVVVGVFSIVTTLLVLRVITMFTPVSVFSLNLLTVLGFGLAIDYSLFVLRRYREELRAGREAPDAVRVAVRTAGRTVLFSSVTVALALSALLVFPQYFLRSFAYAGIAVVALTAVVTLVVLPAILALLGRRIELLDVRNGWRRLRGLPPRTGQAATAASPGWRRLATSIMARPVVTLIASATLLIALGLPFLNITFGQADHRQLPASAQSSQVHEAMRTRFPGTSGLYEVVLTGLGSPGAHAQELAGYAARLSQVPGVTGVDGVAGRFAGGVSAREPDEAAARYAADKTVWFSVSTSLDPNSDRGREAVRALRAVAPPPTAKAWVGGESAQLHDTERAIARGLPWALGILVVTTLVLLFLFTGGLLIPIKALILNLLSLMATFGAAVWVFQEGHLRELLGGFQVTGYLDMNVLVLIFCMAFGLSMDYEVFMLSRMRERYTQTGRNTESVAFGLERTGGIVTAAAALICVVLVGLATSEIVDLKLIGVGLTLAIVVDATVVRCLLVPAVMRLAGDANWWAPRPLRRVYERFAMTE